MIPSPATLVQAFNGQSAFSSLLTRDAESTPSASTSKWSARQELYTVQSVIDDAKNKATRLSDAAVAELEKTSSKAQPKPGQIPLYSGQYYAACAVSGVLACGLTHAAITPLDLVKCRRQVDSKLYTGNFQAWGKIYRTEGFRGVFTGWGPTLWGYSIQGGLKYGGYEFFKKFYGDLVGEENFHKYKTAIYLAGSASAEIIADVGLCPFEAVKVRMQTTSKFKFPCINDTLVHTRWLLVPPFATTTFGGISTVTSAEGFGG